MLTLHHLRYSQSERIVLLLEELGLEYELKSYDRDRKTVLAPAELKNIPGNVAGTAPVLHDDSTGITIPESSAICAYVLLKYNPEQRLMVSPDSPEYGEFLTWFHFANANMQAEMLCLTFGRLAARGKDGKGDEADNPGIKAVTRRVNRDLAAIDAQLAKNKWFVGDTYTAADVMNVWALTTMRYFAPISLKGYDNILRWLKDIGDRPAYKKAMEKGDPGMELLLGPDAPKKGFLD